MPLNAHPEVSPPGLLALRCAPHSIRGPVLACRHGSGDGGRRRRRGQRRWPLWHRVEDRGELRDEGDGGAVGGAADMEVVAVLQRPDLHRGIQSAQPAQSATRDGPSISSNGPAIGGDRPAISAPPAAGQADIIYSPTCLADMSGAEMMRQLLCSGLIPCRRHPASQSHHHP